MHDSLAQDAGKAMYWLEKAAAQGNARALAALADGFTYEASETLLNIITQPLNGVTLHTLA
eukprot:3138557-Amphidinium_carterae.1